CQRHNSYPPTF
nr:immunoglobulin light chain junction region [Macaca mulatta]